MAASGNIVRLRISGMDCADCALTIERAVRQLDGAGTVNVNLATETLEATGALDFDEIARRIRALGYDVEPSTAAERVPHADIGWRGFLAFLWRQPYGPPTLLLALTLPVAQTFDIATAADIDGLNRALQLATILALGLPIGAKGVRSLVIARRISIDLLIAIAALGAVAIGATGEAAAVIVLFTLGESLEGFSAERARASLRGLAELAPSQALLLARANTAPGSRPETVDIASLGAGDLVLARAGERVPVDGRLREGRSTIDESALTGESVPVVREPGDEVFAGTINGAGSLKIEVTRPPADFAITQIARLVEQTQSRRSAAERYVDRFASWYTPAIVLVATAVAAIPPLAFGEPFLGTTLPDPGWAYRGLALLIVACPCALVISIPVTVVSALTRLASVGVLVKGGAFLQALAEVRVFAFDKTGTLTRGRPTVTGLRATDCLHDAAGMPVDCAPCDDLLAVAAAVEGGSAHPYARAVVAEARSRTLADHYPMAESIEAHAGLGVSGLVAGQRIAVGSAALIDDSTSDESARDAGRSVMLVSENGRVKGRIFVEDGPRSSTRAALAALRGIDPSYRFVMLTGDRLGVATRIAGQLEHIDEIRADLLPAGKLAAIEALEREHGDTAMVGDGINDAPALAAAGLGIAMGGAASHQAMEVADVVLMSDDLGQLPAAVVVSRKTQRVIKQNIALSLGLKVAFLALAVPGLAALWMAVVADVGATVLVTLNGMRLLRHR